MIVAGGYSITVGHPTFPSTKKIKPFTLSGERLSFFRRYERVRSRRGIALRDLKILLRRKSHLVRTLSARLEHVARSLIARPALPRAQA
jgi:hypothetical protein